MESENCLPEGQIALDLLAEEYDRKNLTTQGCNFYAMLYYQSGLRKEDLAKTLSKKDFKTFTQLEVIIDWINNPNNRTRPELTRIFKNYPLSKL